jgi:hypothetical protein
MTTEATATPRERARALAAETALALVAACGLGVAREVWAEIGRDMGQSGTGRPPAAKDPRVRLRHVRMATYRDFYLQLHPGASDAEMGREYRKWCDVGERPASDEAAARAMQRLGDTKSVFKSLE